MANGWGSRERARLALKRMQQAPKYDESAMVNTVAQSDEDVIDAKALATSSGSPQVGGSKRSVIRWSTSHITANEKAFMLYVEQLFCTLDRSVSMVSLFSAKYLAIMILCVHQVSYD